jgi:hypothetical protein
MNKYHNLSYFCKLVVHPGGEEVIEYHVRSRPNVVSC